MCRGRWGIDIDRTYYLLTYKHDGHLQAVMTTSVGSERPCNSPDISHHVCPLHNVLMACNPEDRAEVSRHGR